MRSAENIKQQIKNAKIKINQQVKTNALNQLINELETSKSKCPAPPMPSIWRIIMTSKIAKLTSAAVITIAIALSTITFVNNSATPAYAIEQTLQAMQEITTVHLTARDWANNKFEMWILLNPETGKPEYCRTYHPSYDYLTISTPTKSYQYREKDNHVQINSGKLLKIDVAPAKMFQQLLQAEQNGNPNLKVVIKNEYDSEAGKELIIAFSETPQASWKIFIDPQTKLPVRMNCIKMANKMGSFFKDIDSIEFNVDLPEGIFEFEIPENAKIIDCDKNRKILNDPQYGISTENLTEQQAAEKIVTIYWNALIDSDIESAKKVYPIYPQVVESSLLNELVEVGKLYVEPGCGIGKLIPCTLRYKDGSLKKWNLIIKKRNIQNSPSCVIAGFYDSPSNIE